MFNRQSIHIAMLLWGTIFCCIAALCLFMSKNFDREKRKWLLMMQVACAVLLFNDALAWNYRGDISQTGWYLVRISNFMVFLFSDLLLLLYHGYVCVCLFKDEAPDRFKREWRIKAVGIIAVIAMVLVVISQFTNLYYYIDAQNLYHRNTTYIVFNSAYVWNASRSVTDHQLPGTYQQNDQNSTNFLYHITISGRNYSYVLLWNIIDQYCNQYFTCGNVRYVDGRAESEACQKRTGSAGP